MTQDKIFLHQNWWRSKDILFVFRNVFSADRARWDPDSALLVETTFKSNQHLSYRTNWTPSSQNWRRKKKNCAHKTLWNGQVVELFLEVTLRLLAPFLFLTGNLKKITCRASAASPDIFQILYSIRYSFLLFSLNFCLKGGNCRSLVDGTLDVLTVEQ